jgi:hypothetical protein
VALAYGRLKRQRRCAAVIEGRRKAARSSEEAKCAEVFSNIERQRNRNHRRKGWRNASRRKWQALFAIKPKCYKAVTLSATSAEGK